MQVFFFAILFLMQAAFAQSDDECVATEPDKKANKEFVLSIGKFTDNRDGKTYKTTKVGSQTWMAENLNYAASSSKCYENKLENCAKYGRLYSWETVKNVCPIGWRLPRDEEWKEVVDFVTPIVVWKSGMDEYANRVSGIKLKAKEGWGNNGNGTDDYGFSALPGGRGNSGGDFIGVGYDGHWWSQASSYYGGGAYIYSMYHNYNEVNFSHGEYGMRSVRCIKD